MTAPLPHEPHKIKTVRPIAFPSLEQRKRFLADAHFNVGRLTPSQVTYDLCSRGTGAMTQEQLSGQLVGDEAYAGAVNFENLARAVTAVLGHTYVCPTHNLLGSLKLVVTTLAPPGSVIPTNAPSLADVLAPRGLKAIDVRAAGQPAFSGDGCTVSGKKDFLINIGGLLAFKDNALWKEKAEELLRIYEGGVADGGLAAADLAAMARGVEEMLDDRYIRTRVTQTEKLGRLLLDGGVPIVLPAGTHAIFLDCKRFLPHVDQDEFPAQRLAAEIYVETGVRAMERGNVSKGRGADGKNCRPALELVRLTLPRRVYSHDHMKAIAAGIIRLYQRRETIRGLKFVYEPPHLRFFQARFEPLA